MTSTSTVEELKTLPFAVRVLVTFTKMNAANQESKFKEEIVFKIDRPSAAKPWYVLRNYLVPKYLINKYGPQEVGWQRIYEIKIVKLINRIDLSDITDVPLRVMTMDQLEAYCKKWDLAFPVAEFYNVEKAREMVALRELDEKGYQRHYEEYTEGKKRAYPELDGMRGDVSPEMMDLSEFEQVDPLVVIPEEVKSPEKTEKKKKDPFGDV